MEKGMILKRFYVKNSEMIGKINSLLIMIKLLIRFYKTIKRLLKRLKNSRNQIKKVGQ